MRLCCVLASDSRHPGHTHMRSLMEAKLVRASDGRVLFMEASSELVDTLLAVLNTPIGSVLHDVLSESSSSDQANGHVALRGLVESTYKLRPVVFEVPHGEALPKKMALEDLTSDHTSAQRPRQTEPSLCLMCTKLHGAQIEHYNDADQYDEYSASCAYCGNPMWEGMCPQTYCCRSCRCAWIMQCVSSYNHCLRCIVHNSGGQNTISQMISCARCLQIKRCCSACKMCDVCGIYDCGFDIEGLEVPPSDTKRAVCKQTVTFLITNELEVFENTFGKGLEIMSQAGDIEVKGLKYQMIELQPADIRSMLRHALSGSSRILDRTFPCNADVGEEAAGQSGGRIACPVDLASGEAIQCSDLF
mmetsp:Transcript_40928/g.109031  ORF Transcript_40928/g.109031 Transcript_40928/m.109031 type:complete len:360 (+) Transcript_40928:1-1080(+)